jgi:hypothetical protein
VLPLLLPALCSSLLGTLQSQHDAAAAAASLLQQRLQAAECGTARPKAVELGTMLLKLCCRHCYHHDAAVPVQQPAAAMTADGQRWHSQARSLQTLQQQLDSLQSQHGVATAAVLPLPYCYHHSAAATAAVTAQQPAAAATAGGQT